MTYRLLDGKALAQREQARLHDTVATMAHRPGLAVILVEGDAASEIYVRRKKQVGEQLGFFMDDHHLPPTISQSELENLIHELNEDPKIHGILLQLPLPKHLDSDRLLEQIKPEKDADGFHPINLGKLALGQPAPAACTPCGIMNLLKSNDVAIAGKKAVVIGRSRIVGLPIALMLMKANATVTICHSRTADLAAECRQADILIVAIGKAHLVTPEFIKPGAVVVDVGMNRLPDGKLVGDVDFDSVAPLCSAITPVPGGVGPMTIIHLMDNTMKAAQQAQ